MPQLFHEQPVEVRAQQVWVILIGAAANRQTLTYLDLALRMGFNENSRHILRQFLDPVSRYCQREDLPALTVLVVSEASGQPGVGLQPFIRQGYSYEAERELVYQEDWYQYRVPSRNDFRRE